MNKNNVKEDKNNKNNNNNKNNKNNKNIKNNKKDNKIPSVLFGIEHNLFSFLSLIVLLSWKVVKYIVIFMIILLLISIIFFVVNPQETEKSVESTESRIIDKKVIIIDNSGTVDNDGTGS